MAPDPRGGSALGRRAFLVALPGVVGMGRVQATRQDTSAAGRLYNPNVVQSRRRVVPLDNDETIKAIEHQLRCTCGCNLDIYTCRTTDFTCESSPALHREVVALFEQGKDADAILDDFVSRYGEAMLMAPPPEGFNLAGYLVPGVTLTLVAGILVAYLLRRRSVTAASAAPEATPMAESHATAEELEQLAQALRESGG